MRGPAAELQHSFPGDERRPVGDVLGERAAAGPGEAAEVVRIHLGALQHLDPQPSHGDGAAHPGRRRRERSRGRDEHERPAAHVLH